LLNQYKTHVWCLVEFNCGAYFHASSTLLEKISQVQRSFLTKLGLSEAVAFLDHNFAPTVLRRNIAILGLLHKRVLGLCHPAYDRLLPWWPEESRGDRGAHGHSKQLYDHNQEITHHWSLFNNSIFRMINIYNNLPQHVVDATDVSEFQSILTEKARERCEQGFPQWEMSFSARGGPEVSGISTWIRYLS
jgi:hypothetical protein